MVVLQLPCVEDSVYHEVLTRRFVPLAHDIRSAAAGNLSRPLARKHVSLPCQLCWAYNGYNRMCQWYT